MKSIKMRGVVAAVAGALMFGFGANAMADSTDDIVNALMAKGVLTEEEGALLLKGREGEKAGNAKKPVVKEKDGSFSLSSGDGKNSVALTGRLHFDYRQSDMDNFAGAAADAAYPYSADPDSKSVGDHFRVRRARIGIKGRLGGVADYMLQGNITGTNTLDEAYIDINKYDQAGFKYGKFKVPYGLEQQTSSNNIDFLERSYVDQNVPAKRMGAMVHGSIPGFTYQGDVFQMNDSALSQNNVQSAATSAILCESSRIFFKISCRDPTRRF
jgi:phosphate-selective porin OprO/OprP